MGASIIWDKLFKNGPSRICGRQPLKNFTWSILEYFVTYINYVNVKVNFSNYHSFNLLSRASVKSKSGNFMVEKYTK